VSEIYFLIFWIPTIASALSLWIAWNTGTLSRPLLLLAWFGIALFLQIVTFRFSPGWAIGLGLQAALAVYLSLRRKLDL
jgi:hypothetical protein